MTDIGFNLGGPPMTPGFGTVSIEAFSPGIGSLGRVEFEFGDGQVTGQTPEDRFIGWTDPRGISEIRVGITSLDWEMDHIQYGGIPAPGSLAAVLAAGAMASCRRRWH